MAVGVAALIAVIVSFKAAGAWRGLLLPLGVSYYSFKLISYLIEVYWDDEAVERDPVVFFLFPAFFPQIVSGPIQRPAPFFAQMREIMGETDRRRAGGNGTTIHPRRTDDEDAGRRPARRLHRADRQIARRAILTRVMITTVACYLLQLYADFSGYTNIALGVGKLFGIEGPPNFNAPFAAVNIQEIWRRWHMSLTLWLTDYFFTPMSWALHEYGQAALVAAICLNMIIIGLWHGFTLNFLVFGVFHAILLSATVLILAAPQARKRKEKELAAVRLGASARRGLPRRRPDLCSDEFVVDLFPCLDMGRGCFHSRAGGRRYAERVDRLVGHAGLSHRSRLDLHGDCALCRRRGARRPGRSRRSERSPPTGCNTAFACSCSPLYRSRGAEVSSMGNFDVERS